MLSKFLRRSLLIFIIKGFRTIVFIFIVISTKFRPICPPTFFRCLLSKFLRRSFLIFIIKGFRTIVFIFIVISTKFRPIYPPAFFRCLSNSGTFMELRTASFIETTGVAYSDSVSHNRVQLLSLPVLLHACSEESTNNLQMIVSLEAMCLASQAIPKMSFSNTSIVVINVILAFMWYKARNMKHTMRIELTTHGRANLAS